MKTGLEGKPWYYGLAAGLVAGGLLLLIVYFLKLSPMKETIVAQTAQLADLQRKIQEGRAAQLQLPQFREEVRNLELELEKLLRILPARRNTPDLLRRIRGLAEQGDFALQRFTPGSLSDKEFFSEWPIAISVQGGYHNLALFFDRISRFSRIVNVENLAITAVTTPKSPHTIGATFTAKTFVYKESTPTEGPAGGPAGVGARPTGAAEIGQAAAQSPGLNGPSLGRGGSPE